ncbi:cation-translocating P-type ATPase [Pendulispora rubella]|uniref:Cation-translocating P-type ATPase n=1 Tax=Pendulispora rubella TaxID=2741070 RepID=A0ABZ2KYI9_9BACT
MSATSTPGSDEPVDKILERLSCDPARGLTQAEARARLERDGRNELPPPPKPSALKRFFNQFANPIVLTLLAAAVIALINGATQDKTGPFLVRFGDAIAIFLIVALNAVLGYYQEQRAEAALDALQKMQTPSARVRRDDKVLMLSAAELVAGDVLEVEAGDAVPADARLLQTINLATEESSLTGESVPVGKDAREKVPADAALGDRANMLFVGSNVVRGKGRAVVVATGTRTELGKLSELIRGAGGDRTTPLEAKLDQFGKRILLVCLALSVLLFARGMWKGDRHWHELLLEAVSLAVAAIPEGLPAITTITLALGMQRMAKRGAIVRKLAAVETLGAATVICSDKTGTLTQNEMTVTKIYSGRRSYKVTGIGYDPRGSILGDEGDIMDTPSKPLRHLLQIVALCNNAELDIDDEGNWRAVGDPTEAALLTLSAKGGLPKESILPSHQLLKELPFDSDRKRMTILTLDAKGREVVHTKGSADVLLPLCTHFDDEDGLREMTAEDRDCIVKELERMSSQQLRVLAVARRILGTRQDATDATDPSFKDSEPEIAPKTLDLEQGLTFVGLVGMIDPPRAGVKEAVAACATAQVRAVMITGDHKLTAVAIARELGLWEDGALALTGAELEKMSPEELEKRVEDVRVFARVTAEQKLRIVRAFKNRGHVVAMTGDGVNDAPALREAHIGVAMGKGGTDVARQAADMVIADDNFATIVEAVREGRAIYRNIQKFIFFLLSANAGLLVTVFVASFLDVPPLTPLMILWINLVTNGLPALALGVDPPDATQMSEPPRKTTTGLLTTREYLGILYVGLWMGGAGLLTYFWPFEHGIGGSSRIEERAAAFSLLALSPLFHALSCRSATMSIAALKPKISGPLALAILLSGAIHLVSVFVPALRPVFRTYLMTGEEWLILLLLSASIVPGVELMKLLQRVGIGGRTLGPVSRRSTES